MQVDYMVLADAASASEGKHYIHGGGWDTILAPNFPVSHPLIAVAVRLRTNWNETNQPHTLELDLVDEDGQSVLPEKLSGTINIGRPPTLRSGADQVFPFVMNLQGLTFNHPGTYVVVLHVDQAEGARSAFTVTNPLANQ